MVGEWKNCSVAAFLSPSMLRFLDYYSIPVGTSTVATRCGVQCRGEDSLDFVQLCVSIFRNGM